eukprot:JP445971.1.p2 GENE.JP445971.1~~JP445971.1.p2  ORF type:complete len:861 (+),score=325.07 JP445971.1:224-2584(+)
MERILRFFKDQITKVGITMGNQFDPIRDNVQKFNFNELEMHLEELEKEIANLNTNQETLSRNHNEVEELKHVLQKAAQFFGSAPTASDLVGAPGGEQQTGLLDDTFDTNPSSKSTRLGSITGVIMTDKLFQFERVLFRATRGNMFLRSTPIPEPIADPHTGEKVQKSVFVVFFSGERAQQRIGKLSDSFSANRYPFPENPSEQGPMLQEVETRLADLRTVIDRTLDHRYVILNKIAMSLESWATMVSREKAIYHSLNMFDHDVKRKCLIAEGWCPTESVEAVQDCLTRATQTSGASVPSVLNVLNTHDTPPTHFKTNKFTIAFQEIVDAYGIARYREYNPAVFTCITFPFLFGIMFGDVGHGILMTLFASYLIFNEKKLGAIKLNELVETCFEGRYIIILMGVFAIYTGAIYNEVFSVPFDLFGSNYEEVPNNDYKQVINVGEPYPFGVDPGWAYTPNKLNFFNSLKMKMSIFFGVSQMLMGNFCKLSNGIHFQNKKDIFFEFIPEVVFMTALFGYLNVLIFIKWGTDFNATCVYVPPKASDAASMIVSCLPDARYSGNGTYVNEAGTLFVEPGGLIPNSKDLGYIYKQPPASILNTLIQMFMSIGSVSVENQFYAGQGGVQLVLVLIAVIMLPILLLPKPCMLRAEAAAGNVSGHGHGGHGEEFDFSETMVHQIIHTIEYALGAVSNTASYLRLWALSLAHAQLSEVFWEKVMVAALEMDNAGAIFAGFAVWATLTVAVLMIMESLSAFLHALRLHWVEWNNKFYTGDGYKFLPFSYARLVAFDE